MNKGDIVYVDFDIKIKETGEYYSTTRVDVAKKNDLYDEKREYGPVPVIVGTGFESVGFDKALEEMDIGDEKELDIPEEEGHGKRDVGLIELVPMRTIQKLPQFREGDSYPAPGMPVFIGDRRGYIRMVGAGRVRVDYNHPLAGKVLVYNIKAIRKAESDREIVEAVFDMHYSAHAPPGIELGEDMIRITLPEMCKYDKAWQGVKFMIIAGLREHLTVTNFQLIEEYKPHKQATDGGEASKVGEVSKEDEVSEEEKGKEEGKEDAGEIETGTEGKDEEAADSGTAEE